MKFKIDYYATGGTSAMKMDSKEEKVNINLNAKIWVHGNIFDNEVGDGGGGEMKDMERKYLMNWPHQQYFKCIIIQKGS